MIRPSVPEGERPPPPSRPPASERDPGVRSAFAMVGMAIAGTLAVIGWAVVILAAVLWFGSRNGPEGMAGFSAVLIAILALPVAAALTAVTAWLRVADGGGRRWRVAAIVFTTVAALAFLPCIASLIKFG